MPELNITDDEASMLVAVLAYVGGSPTNSPREHERTLYKKLNDLGYSFTQGKAEEFHKMIQSTNEGKYAGMQFKDYPEPFEPGYFRRKGVNEGPPVSAHWWVYDPGHNYVRVNVTPVSDRKPGDELSREDLDALPVGAKVRDRDADTWTKATNGYWYIDDEEDYVSSDYVHTNYYPVIFVSE